MDINGEIDVFISYTHVDNEPLSKEQKEEEGWISRFHHSLEKCLWKLLGRKPIIWRDVKLQGNDEFSDVIISKIQKAKALVAVISPCYLNSQWCMKELHQFLKAAKDNGGIRVGNKSRIFKIVKTYIPHNEHPDEIRGLLGYDFFQLDEEGRPNEFMSKEGLPYFREFLTKLKDVAWDIHKFLKEVDKQRETGEKPPVSSPKKTVYLAETTSDLQEERENIQRELKQKGYTILPDRQLPLLSTDGDFRDSVREYLKCCRLSIHLIGNMYPARPEGEDRSIIDLQSELAMEQCKKNQLKQLIWIPPGLEKSNIDERQVIYIKDSQNNAPRDEFDLVVDTLENFKNIIQDTLKKIDNPPSALPPSTPGGSSNDHPRVYLIYDKKDIDENIKTVSKCLIDEKIEVLKPLSEGTPAQYRKIHKDNLSLCDAAIIYYARADEYWLKTNRNDILKAAAYRKKKPPPKAGIFITGEKTEHKEEFFTYEAKITKDYNPCFCEALKEIVDYIQAGKGGSQ